MKGPTQQQLWLGWESVDLKGMYFLCMCKVGTAKSFPLSGHQSLTSALHKNGNMARDWMADGGIAEQSGNNRYNKGIWTLIVDGQSVKLFVEHIDRTALSPVSIDPTPLKSEKATHGNCGILIDAVGML